MAELVQMQQAEILKLQKILKDAHSTPQRKPVSLQAAISYNERGTKHQCFVAIDDRGIMWASSDWAGSDGRFFKWERVPGLPQPADEADLG